MNGNKIHIEENTSYPYDYSIEFKIEIRKPTLLDIKIRKPSWADKFSVNENYVEKDGFIVIHKTWKNNDKISIRFFPEPEVKKDANNEYYFTYGALVLAHPIAVTENITRNYPLPGFHDFQYRPVSLVVYKCAGDTEPGIKIENKDKLEFTTSVFNPVSKKDEAIELVPMGKTILRQVSFSQAK